jgi:hypothetical protein
MARIQTYNNDVDIDDADKLVGTDGTVGADLNKTKNFALGDIKAYACDSPVLTNVPVYADNAAAVLAGLAIGSVYRTSDNLKIVHI